ncbi:MAG: alpha-amylase family glycosyl hydrolase [Lachnospiraceae bacterium]
MKPKKLLSILLTCTMAASAVPASASTVSYRGGTYFKVTNTAAFNDTIYPATRTDLRDEAIYYLMITRFYDGDSNNNVHCWDDAQAGNPDSDPAWRGDFQGLIEKLDYIKALGFTAVELFPVAQNASGYDYHGCHPINLKKVDSRFESEGYTYQDLIDACHEKGLKVIQQIELNHSSNFGEETLAKMFEVNENADRSNLEETLTPTKEFLDVYGLSSAEEYWAQSPSIQYQQRLNFMKNLGYDSDNGNSTDTYPQEKDYDIGKLSSSDVFNPRNNYHSGYFQSLNWDDWSCKFSQIAGDCVDINTENPDVGLYLAQSCKMYADMGVDAIYIDNARHITRASLNLGIIKPLKEMLKAEGKNIEIYTEVCTRYTDIWYRGHATQSVPYYTWEETDEALINSWVPAKNTKVTAEEINTNMNLAFDQLTYDDDPANQPTSDNAFLNGITYHEPDYTNAGVHAFDFNMHRNFGSASTAYNKAVEGDKYFNDSTWNITGVDTFDYSPETPNERLRFTGGTDTWAENLCLMYTFRGIPRVSYGTEVEFQKGAVWDVGPNAPLATTGRAYYGDYMEGNVTTDDLWQYTASGTVADTLSSPLAIHIQALNGIRRAIPALRKGQYTTSDNYVSGDMAFIRRYTNADEGVDSLALVTITSSAEF